MAERLDAFSLSAQRTSRARRPAIITATLRIRWGELHDDILRWSSALSDLGLARGARCAILAQPGEDYLRLLLSLWAIGVVAAPVNRRLPAALIRQQLNLINCSALIVDAAHNTTNADGIKKIAIENIRSASRNAPATITNIVIPYEQPATLIFTSGSTGEGKACLHTFGNHYFNALGSNENIVLAPNDRWLLSLPLFHVAGLGVLFRCLLSGAAIAVADDGAPLADALLSLRPSHISLVATQLQRVLDDESAVGQLRGMKAILLGGSAMPEKLIRRAFDLGLPIFTSYGSTEMASQVATTRPGDSFKHLLSSGRVLPQREIEISADAEILIRGACLGIGYFRKGEIEPLVDENGWFHSGDCGLIDEQGFLHVTGRLDNMFISGGENIHPEEIEKVMQELDGVEHVVVAAVNDAEFGQRPAAFVKMAGTSSLDDLEIDALRAKLPGLKIPHWLLPWPAEYESAGIKIERAFFQRLAEKMCRPANR